MRIAVIVNDMSEVNIDAALVRDGGADSSRMEEQLVEMTNSCICCTLREDLLVEVSRLARESRFDYLLIESTGISDPLPVADPSVALSTYSLEKMREVWFEKNVVLFPQNSIASVTGVDATYKVTAQDGRRLQTSVPPLLAGGFEGSHKLVAELFGQRDDGFPLLSEHDESTIEPGVYLCGPAVRHDNHVFCFIYKYRQRFAVVAKTIAISLGLPAEELEMYRKWRMYLDDLSCCGEECVC